VKHVHRRGGTSEGRFQRSDVSTEITSDLVSNNNWGVKLTGHQDVSCRASHLFELDLNRRSSTWDKRKHLKSQRNETADLEQALILSLKIRPRIELLACHQNHQSSINRSEPH
jgi:hypothetical protein